jgi:hypothetical protein
MPCAVKQCAVAPSPPQSMQAWQTCLPHALPRLHMSEMPTCVQSDSRREARLHPFRSAASSRLLSVLGPVV